MSGLACVALDGRWASRLADSDTRACLSGLVQDMEARAPATRFARLGPPPSVASGARDGAASLVRRMLPAAAIVLPPRAVSLAEDLALAAAYRPSRSSLPARLGANIVFCPAVGPSVHDPAVPLVCGIDSLAFLAYPESFGVEEAFARGYLLRRALRLAARVVCPSEFVRAEVLAMAAVEPERVVVVRPGMSRSNSPPLQPGLRQDEFLFYPAPFVRYANHRLLLVAFGQYRAQHPDSRLKLVCAGSPGSELPVLEQSVERMHLGDSVVLRSQSADQLYDACRGVILPQLYEASARTALTAMAAGVPVLSGGAGALGEVVGDAGLSFDPRRPASLLEAIALADRAPADYRALGSRGRARGAQLGGGPSEADQYLRLLGEVA